MKSSVSFAGKTGLQVHCMNGDIISSAQPRITAVLEDTRQSCISSDMSISNQIPTNDTKSRRFFSPLVRAPSSAGRVSMYHS